MGTEGGTEEGRVGRVRRRGEIVILSTSTCTQIPNHKQTRKHIRKQYSKQAMRQSKLKKLQNVC